jgi:hypothetical protein
MNATIRDQIWRGSFRATKTAFEFGEKIRSSFGLSYFYDPARLCLGRSIFQATPLADWGAPLPSSYSSKSLTGELLFGDQIDLWLAALIMSGELPAEAQWEDVRALVEAHWDRGHQLLKEDLEREGFQDTAFLRRLVGYASGQTPPAVQVGLAGGPWL